MDLIDRQRFDLIKGRHGGYSRWAVWAPATNGPKSNVGDLSIFDSRRNPTLLQIPQGQRDPGRLNISRSFDEPFRNFHDLIAVANDHRNVFAWRDVEAGLEQRQVLREIEANTEMCKFTGKEVVTSTHGS